jgi:hypothetical protein
MLLTMIVKADHETLNDLESTKAQVYKGYPLTWAFA